VQIAQVPLDGRYAADVVLESIGLWFLDRVRVVHQQRRRVRVRVHSAYFVDGEVPYLFINVVNLSHDREVEVTHVWFDIDPRVDVLLTERPDESWEAWVEAAKVAHVSSPETRARVRLSSDRVIKSRRNRDVPPVGFVPGGLANGTVGDVPLDQPLASGTVGDTRSRHPGRARD
jgi:hypothetical protein